MRAWTVRRLLAVLLIANLVIVLLVGLVGGISVYSSTKSVSYLTTQLGPANRANEVVMEDLLNAETYLRGFAIANDDTALASYRFAIAQLPQDELPLARYARHYGHGLPALVRQQHAAWKNWLRQYAVPRVRAGGGQGTYDEMRYVLGVRLFDVIRGRNLAISEELDDAQNRARDEASNRLHATNALIVAVAVIGAMILLVLGWWVTDQVRQPLSRLGAVVARLRAGDHQARASVHGPSEIVEVGRALNHLADESHRAREMELAVHAQLKDIDAAKSDFISNVSHELRTPLTIITGYLELLEEEISHQLTPELANMLDVTRRNVMRLRELIEDLLTLNKAELTGTTLESVDLRTIVSDAAHDMGFAAAARGIRIRVHAPDEPVVALGDSSQLHRAVLNLVSNAVKFSPDGAEVDIDLSEEADDAKIQVRDHGMGVPAADQDKIGARFFRASNAVKGEIAGTGLGLRIVQTIITNHHGSFTLKSAEGEGTTARIRMPLHRAVGDEIDGMAPARPAGVPGESTADSSR